MKPTDALFLLCVCVVAALFVFATALQTHFATPTAALPSAAGGSGRPRDIDINRIRGMIERGELSGREAEFYRETPAGSQDKDTPPPK